MVKSWFVLALALVSAPSFAQSAMITIFAPEPASPRASTSDLAQEFESLGSIQSEVGYVDPPPPPFVNPLDLDVPDWMRGSRSAEMFADYRLARSGCGSRDYYLFPGIGADSQRRRAIYFDRMARIACEEGVSVRLLDALIVQESRYNPSARSHAGAMGLTQLMPGTARMLGVNQPFDPEQNMRGGAQYLREQLDRFGSVRLALGAYNAGPGRIEQYNGLPPFRETRNYVRTILSSLSDVETRLSAASVIEQTAIPVRAVRLSAY